MFTDLLNDTVRIQGQVYQLMSQQGWYNVSSDALASEVTKQVRQYEQSRTQAEQFVQQHQLPGLAGTFEQQVASPQNQHP